ncbi:hypothetical protein [Flagellimonas pelagia]|nr:hypothetical protein [Allomuricauda maritima]
MRIKDIVFLIGVILLGSCSDFLEEKPLSELTVTNFFHSRTMPTVP